MGTLIFDVGIGTGSIIARLRTNPNSLCGITFRRIDRPKHHDQRFRSIVYLCTEPSNTCATRPLHNPPTTKSQCVVEHTHDKTAANPLHCRAKLSRIHLTTPIYIETGADIEYTCSNVLDLVRDEQGL